MSLNPFIRWCLSLGNKFFRVVPWQTSWVVLLTLSSQLTSLLAFFLPLKVVILLGSEGIPRYFPASWSSVDRDLLIVSLSGATVAFFLLHLIAERGIDWVTGVGTARLLAKSRKVILFRNQDELAGSAYQRYTRALASVCFIAISMATMFWLYPGIAIVISLHGIIVALLLLGLSLISSGFKEKLNVRLNQLLKLAGGVGFFIAFGFLVADFVLGSPPSLIVAIVAILLLRQMTNRVVSLVKDMVWLQKQKTKVDALFFHGKVLMPTTKPEKTIWPLIARETREAVVSAVYRELVDGAGNLQRITWHQTGVQDVAGLRFVSDGEYYLLKIYGTRRKGLALHEASLVSEDIAGLPSPEFLGTTVIQKFSCLLYRLPNGYQPSTTSLRTSELEVRSRLMSVSLSQDIICRFERSKPMLWQRLDSQLCRQLYSAAASDNEYERVAIFEGYLGILQRILRSLPLALVVPDIKEDQLWLLFDGSGPLVTHLGSWSVEPLGAGWPVKPCALSKLEIFLKEKSSTVGAFSEVDPINVELAALTYALEDECNRQRFIQALSLVEVINSRLLDS